MTAVYAVRLFKDTYLDSVLHWAAEQVCPD